MNPFENVNVNDLIKNRSSATSKMFEQINEMNVGDSVKIELHGLTAVSARGCLSNRMRKMKERFVTKMPNNELWVLRVS